VRCFAAFDEAIYGHPVGQTCQFLDCEEKSTDRRYNAATVLTQVALMFGVDVPIYSSDRVADEVSGRIALEITQSLLNRDPASAGFLLIQRNSDFGSEAHILGLFLSDTKGIVNSVDWVPAIWKPK
jgi:hypothetical protein